MSRFRTQNLILLSLVILSSCNVEASTIVRVKTNGILSANLIIRRSLSFSLIRDDFYDLIRYV